jgi:hypothetical protein
MAKTLKEFLKERADRDLLALRALQGASEAFCEGTKYLALVLAHQDGIRSRIEVPHEVIGRAMQTAISAAGETVKKIERTQPDLKSAYPDYPWAAVKRLRDAYAHPVRLFLGGASSEPVMKNWKKLDEYYAKTKPEDRFSGYEPLLEELAGAWNVTLALRHFTHTYKNSKTVNITDHNLGEHISKFQPHIVKKLPWIVAHYNQRHCLIGIGDAIGSTSLFFREAENFPVDPRPILAIRNRAAHFVDPPDHRRKPDDPNMFGELRGIEPGVSNVSESLAKLPRKTQSAESSHWQAQMAAIYYDEMKVHAHLDGNTEMAAQKEVLLDRAVEFITQSSKNPRELQDAFIMATANLISVSKPDEAERVLDYVFARGEAIREPGKIKADMSGLSYPVQVKARQFLDEVIRLSKPIGNKLGQSH